jgi:hypothetical protein
MPINSQRWFMRKEEYAQRRAQPDSPFRQFDMKCLKCGSYKMTITVHHDPESGDTFVQFLCTSCRQQEKIAVSF